MANNKEKKKADSRPNLLGLNTDNTLDQPDLYFILTNVFFIILNIRNDVFVSPVIE